MDFLLKKSWHPSRIQNVEKVWKAEQEAVAEKQRIMELQRKLQEERQIEELKRLNQVSSGSKAKPKRLDWMYEGGVKVTSAQEYLEGKPYEEPKEEAPKSGLGLFQNAQASAEQDTWNRLREDPLLEMRRQEQKSIEFIKKNPVKMAMIKEKLYEMEKRKKDAKKRKHQERKEKKKDKKRHKSSHHHHHDKREEKDRKDAKEGSPKADEVKPLKTGYGLIYPKGAPKKETTGSSPTREIKDFDTIKKEMRLAKAQEREERDKEAQKKREERRRRQGQYQGMSAEERKRKLEEMQQDAATNEERRDSRLKRHKDDEVKREEQDVSAGDPATNFLNDVKKKAYSKAGVATLEERLNRNVHYRYKGNLEEANTFKDK